MFTVKKTPHGYIAHIDFFKSHEDVCCGNPSFYILAYEEPHSSEYRLDIGIMDEDDVDIYAWTAVLDSMDELFRAFEYSCMELYDKRYLKADSLYKTYSDYVAPLVQYLSGREPKLYL